MALTWNHLKSRDPSDQALASLERAAPPSPAGPQPRRARLPRPVQSAAGQIGAAGLGPLQAGAPAWQTPGLLRSPLHHQGRRSGSSRGACRSGLLRGRRSRPGQIHAGAPAWRGLGGVVYSKDARGRFEGGIRHSSTAQTIATPHEKQIPRKPKCSPPVVSPRTTRAKKTWGCSYRANHGRKAHSSSCRPGNSPEKCSTMVRVASSDFQKSLCRSSSKYTKSAK